MMIKRYLFGIVTASFLLGACEKSEPVVSEATCMDDASLYKRLGNNDSDLPCLIPQTEKKALVLYFMSNDCPGCGSWGTKTFHEILKDNPDKTEGLQIHIKYSDPWIIPGFSDSLVQRYKPLFTPFVMVENRVPSSTLQVTSDLSVILPRAKNWVEEISSEQAEIAPALSYRIKGDAMEIHYGGLFQKDGNGPYYFGLYLMEDHLEYNQAGSTVRPYYHNNTIRQAIGGAWGEQVADGSNKAGDVFVKQTSIPLTGYWKRSDLHLLGIVWKRDAQGKMQVVNCIHVR
ncbi:MAG: Omp28-related outer membrane protein [Bacteroidota bacterium]|nr:Omp28-related outer membrane protein [Bacteroidota bacterium]MDX5430272.1 Omp28-related outer membrane protein [Bacteroidota bacterium]MDX5469033.1 Omp28-related outer membrane protein [Bacteroidota bacterium]